MAGALHGEGFRGSLLEGRHRSGHAADLPGLSPQDLCGEQPGGAGDRPLQQGVSWRRSPGEGGRQGVLRLLRRERLAGDGADAEPVRGRAPRRRAGDLSPPHVDTGGVQSTYRNIGGQAANIYDIKTELAPKPGELVIYKERASCFFGTPLVAHLQMKGIDSLIICGESTSGCVRASTVDAYSYGFHNTLVEECTFDRAMLNHKINLFDLHHKYADVMHIEEVLAHLEGLASARKVAWPRSSSRGGAK